MSVPRHRSHFKYYSCAFVVVCICVWNRKLQRCYFPKSHDRKIAAVIYTWQWYITCHYIWPMSTGRKYGPTYKLYFDNINRAYIFFLENTLDENIAVRWEEWLSPCELSVSKKYTQHGNAFRITIIPSFSVSFTVSMSKLFNNRSRCQGFQAPWCSYDHSKDIFKTSTLSSTASRLGDYSKFGRNFFSSILILIPFMCAT